MIIIIPIDELQIHVIIEGRVQGVGFRYYVLEKASELGVSGWVRNTFQGQVEVVAEGQKETLDKFIELLKHGPSLSFITNIEVIRKNASGEFTEFSLRSTA